MWMDLMKLITLKRIFYIAAAAVFVALVALAHVRGTAYKAEVTAREKEHAAHLAVVAAADNKARLKEQAAQAAFNEERKQWDEERQKMEQSIAGLRTNADRLRKTIDAGAAGYLSAGADSGAAAGANAPAQACWRVLGESIGEYEALAREADELNSRLSIGQRWARTLPR